MKKKCTAIVCVPELLPEDVFSHIVCHHADQVRARNAYAANKRRKIKERRFIAFVLAAACILAIAACCAITKSVGVL